jgi:hypothetical protein
MRNLIIACWLLVWNRPCWPSMGRVGKPQDIAQLAHIDDDFKSVVFGKFFLIPWLPYADRISNQLFCDPGWGTRWDADRIGIHGLQIGQQCVSIEQYDAIPDSIVRAQDKFCLAFFGQFPAKLGVKGSAFWCLFAT